MLKTALRCAAASLCALATVAAIIGSDIGASISAQSDEQSGRIVARRLDDGRTEFGWQTAGGERVLPSARYFPAGAAVGRWLRSSPVEVAGTEIGRINARLLTDGRIEFAFTPTNGERILPPSRYFPADARVGRWLRSTEITWSVASRFTAVSAGGSHTCGLRESGAIECWGDNEYGQTDVPGGSFSAVSAGSRHTCALRASGAVECWGDNEYGQTDAPPAGPHNPRGTLAGPSASFSHSCGVRGNGAIECWGGKLAQWPYAGIHDAPTGRVFTSVSANYGYACGLLNNGTIDCWGTFPDIEFPAVPVEHVAPPEGSDFTAVSTGGMYNCGLRESGEIACWGWNVDGEFDDIPVGRFTAISIGAHGCAIRENGEIACWGTNFVRQWNKETGAPEQVYGGQTDAPPGRFSAVSTGGAHTCGLREDGSIECWGDNGSGQSDAPVP